MANFGNLYDYSTASGIVIPQTSDIKSSVEQAFKDIFGGDFSTDATTINGRLIEAITLLFVDVCGVNAQNANGANITQAVGSFLDSVGAMFGISRLVGESDNAYRKRILLSTSRSSGFAQSIMNAVGSVDGVTGVVVLDNGNEDPDLLPKSNLGASLSNSISVAAHSVFICVRGGTDEAVAQAIQSSKSAGCGYTTSEDYGTAITVTLTDSDTGTSFTARFYRPTQRYVAIDITVNGTAYTGDDIEADTQVAIQSLIDDNQMNSVITKADMISAVASVGKNIVAQDITIKVSDTDSTLATGSEVEELVVMPYKFISSEDTTIDVTVE